jgi:glycylpeptide N-tetradecanoyltransferase
MYKLPDTPHFAQLGLREMEERDIQDVTALFARYMQRFDMAPEMTAEEVRHQFLSGRGEGEKDENNGNRRKGQVVWSYVIEVGASHFVSVPDLDSDQKQ